VKKFCLAILILCCYLAALFNAGDVSSQKTFSSSISNVELSYSNYSSGLPETDHELNNLQHFVARTGSSRVQMLMGDLSLVTISKRNLFKNKIQFLDDQETFPSKEYLNHIYPSHNFW
jgi:hypothetical protein